MSRPPATANGEFLAVAPGAERDRLFDIQAQVMPVFVHYQRQTAGRIPVVVLERID
jgi:hypothetical protein